MLLSTLGIYFYSSSQNICKDTMSVNMQNTVFFLNTSYHTWQREVLWSLMLQTFQWLYDVKLWLCIILQENYIILSNESVSTLKWFMCYVIQPYNHQCNKGFRATPHILRRAYSIWMGSPFPLRRIPPSSYKGCHVKLVNSCPRYPW